MPTLDDVKSALLKDGENGEELYKVVSGAILNAKNDRKTHVQNLEAQNSRLLEAAKELGYDGTGEISGFISETKKAIETGRANTEKLTGEQKRLQDLENQIKSVSANFAKSESERIALIEKANKSKVKDAVLPLLKGKIFSAELRAETIANSGKAKLSDDGKVLWVEGEEQMDLAKGVESYLSAPENKDDLRNSQQPGPGGKPGGEPAPGKTMTRSAFLALSPQDQSAKVHEGVAVVDG